MKRKMILILIIIIVLLSAVATYLLFSPKTDPNSQRVNILLLGADARTNATNGFTDSIHILSIDKNTKETYMLSIPRATRVQIAGKDENLINHAYAYGNINTTIDTVEDFLDVRIDYYVVVDFTDFKKMVDTIGGINMNVPQHISDARPELHGKTGMSRLNGEEALILLQFRQDNEGDYGRMGRHREAIKAIADEILNPSNIQEAPAVVNMLRENIKTDIPPLEISVIQQLIFDFNLDNAKIGEVEGTYKHINGIYNMIPDMNKTEATVVELGLRN
ncbi:MAG: LytR family transcriptional regulator [Methanobacterium sp.]|nr:MAG: LytR family transcriptional regulator [Methanobacterium sp.]